MSRADRSDARPAPRSLSLTSHALGRSAQAGFLDENNPGGRAKEVPRTSTLPSSRPQAPGPRNRPTPRAAPASRAPPRPRLVVALLPGSRPPDPLLLGPGPGTALTLVWSQRRRALPGQRLRAQGGYSRSRASGRRGRPKLHERPERAEDDRECSCGAEGRIPPAGGELRGAAGQFTPFAAAV